MVDCYHSSAAIAASKVCSCAEAGIWQTARGLLGGRGGLGEASSPPSGDYYIEARRELQQMPRGCPVYVISDAHHAALWRSIQCRQRMAVLVRDALRSLPEDNPRIAPKLRFERGLMEAAMALLVRRFEEPSMPPLVSEAMLASWREEEEEEDAAKAE